MAIDPRVEALLRELGLVEYVEGFAANAIDHELLPTLTDADLKELGVAALGHRKRILAAASTTGVPTSPMLRATPDEGADGEVKIVTVLFADIVGSTGTIQGLEPEDAANLLRPYVSHAATAVRDCGGTVLQELGDGLFAVFGAPLAVEDHAVRACRAAQRIQQQAPMEARLQKPALSMRVGIHSGEVVVYREATGVRVAGPAVHLAARMEQGSRAGRTLVTRITYDLAKAAFSFTPTESVQAKGFDEAVAAFELGPEKHPDDVMSARAGAPETVLVGRQAELDRLFDAAAKARAGVASVVAISGEPGIGKSRLVRDFLASEATTGFLIVCGAARTNEAERVLGLVREIALALIASLRAPGDRRDIGVEGVAATADDSPLAGLAIRALSGEAVDHPAWKALPQSERQARVAEAFVGLLQEATLLQPVIVVAEDMHWADDGSRAVLSETIALMRDRHFVLVATYRPDTVDTWSESGLHQMIRLAPMPRPATFELLEKLLGLDPSLETLKALLAEATGGNPLFIEETVRLLKESGTVAPAQVGSGFVLTKPVADIALPHSVHSIIAARIDARPLLEREAVLAASVIGMAIPPPLLLSVLGVSAQDLQRTLANLCGAGLLEAPAEPGDGEYRFRHALVRESAYRQLLKSRRRSLHRHVLELLESTSLPAGAAAVEALAYHALHGEAWEACMKYSRQAARQSWLGSMERQAARLLRWAIQSVEHLEHTPENRRIAIDLRLEMRAPLNGIGEIEQLETVMSEARDLANAMDDATRAARAMGHLALAHWRSGKFDATEKEGRRTLAIADELRDPELRALSCFRIGQAMHGRGEYAGAAHYFGLACEQFDPADSAGPLSTGRAFPLAPHFRGWSLVEAGNWQGYREVAPAIDRRSAATGDRFGWEMGCFVHGLAALGLGEPEQALGHVLEAITGRRKLADVGYLVWMSAVGGLAHARLGEFRQSFAIFEPAIRVATRNRHLQYQFPFIYQAEAVLLSGEPDRARTLLEEALRWCKVRNETGYQRKCLDVLAACAESLEEPDAARSWRLERQALSP